MSRALDGTTCLRGSQATFLFMPVQKRYNKPCVIYAIEDHLGNPVYVGATVTPFYVRLNTHYRAARTGRTSRFNQWLAEADRRGEPISMNRLEEVPANGDWMACEEKWIALYRDEGCDLLNETSGGLGLRGRSHTPATREKMSAWQKGVAKPPMADETKEKIRQTLKGRVFTDEHRRLIGESNRRRRLSPETRQKIAESVREYNRKRKEDQESER